MAVSIPFLRALRERWGAPAPDGGLPAGGPGFRALVEESLAAIYVIQDGRFRYVNRGWEEMFGYSREEAVGKLPVEITIAPEDRDLVLENIRRRTSGEVANLRYSFRGVTRDGRRIDVDVAGTRTLIGARPAVIGTALDQTKRNQLQRDALRAQKLEMLALLAGGLAHDVNNVFHSISALAEMLEDALPAGAARDDAKEIERSAALGAALTGQLLAFGRARTSETGPLDLVAAVRGCAPMLRGAAGKSVALELDLPETVGCVRAEPGHVERILMNLVLNARDAMPAGGVARITARPCILAKPGGGGLPAAVLSVRDAGAGMDRTTLERVFEPFFTTKGPGQGTGLGLPIVQRIAELGGGRVDIESAPGAGTDVRVTLPLV